MNCKDDELNAKLYSNRAIAHFYLGERIVKCRSFIRLLFLLFLPSFLPASLPACFPSFLSFSCAFTLSCDPDFARLTVQGRVCLGYSGIRTYIPEYIPAILLLGTE